MQTSIEDLEKVYIVQAWYGDSFEGSWSVVAGFSSKNSAEEFANKFKHETEIIEMIIDLHTERKTYA